MRTPGAGQQGQEHEYHKPCGVRPEAGDKQKQAANHEADASVPVQLYVQEAVHRDSHAEHADDGGYAGRNDFKNV